MNRKSFFKLCLTAAAFLTAPFSVIAKIHDKRRTNKALKVEAGKDRFDQPLALFEGDIFYTKVCSKDTNGDLYIFESTRDKKGGPSLHYHFEQDEWWFVLEGEFLFQVGEQQFTAKPGDSVFGPRRVPHAFAKTNDGPARLLMAFQPAGKMEDHFIQVSQGIYKNMTAEGKDKLRKAHGFKVVGPALTFDKTGN